MLITTVILITLHAPLLSCPSLLQTAGTKPLKSPMHPLPHLPLLQDLLNVIVIEITSDPALPETMT